MLLPSKIKEAMEQDIILCSHSYDELVKLGQVRVNSIDLTLGDAFYRRRNHSWVEGCSRTANEDIVLQPGECVLGVTAERIGTSLGKFDGKHLTFGIDGRSTIARHFLNVHATAGFGDVGYFGHITLELTNHSSECLVIPKGLPVCQVYFQACDGELGDETYAFGSYTQPDGILTKAHILPKLDLFYCKKLHGDVLS